MNHDTIRLRVHHLHETVQHEFCTQACADSAYDASVRQAQDEGDDGAGMVTLMAWPSGLILRRWVRPLAEPATAPATTRATKGA